MQSPHTFMSNTSLFKSLQQVQLSCLVALLYGWRLTPPINSAARCEVKRIVEESHAPS